MNFWKYRVNGGPFVSAFLYEWLPSLFQIICRRLHGAKPLSEPMMLSMTYYKIVSDIIWRSLFRVISGSGVSAYSLWSNPGSLNEYTCDTCSEDYKSGLIDEWNGTKEVSALAHHILWYCISVFEHVWIFEIKPYTSAAALRTRTLRQKVRNGCCTSNRILNSILAKYVLSMITIIQLSSRVGIKQGRGMGVSQPWWRHTRITGRMIPITVSSTACSAWKQRYCKVSNIRHTLVGNKIVDHSDVVGASPVGAAPTTSAFST